jgi:hypothetical protein
MKNRKSRLVLVRVGYVGSGLQTYADKGKTYRPNGEQECARRRRQQEVRGK